MNQAIPILSLVIAALAVIVAPLVSLRVTKWQILAPMRQAWINALRQNVTRLLGSASYLHASGVNLQDPNVAKELKELAIVQQEIQLTINPGEHDHQLLVDKIAATMKALVARDNDEFIRSHQEAVKTAQSIIKEAWEKVK